MADDDFGVESLAAYLHLDRAQVLRLAEREKLPGRKVGGEWRFSPADIHHWLEERIGLSSDAELIEVEGVFDRAAGRAGEAAISIAEMMPLEAIAVPLAARTRASVITSMVDVAARTGHVWDTAKMADAVAQPRRPAAHRPGKRRGPAAPTPAAGQHTGSGPGGLRADRSGHSLWRGQGCTYGPFFPYLVGR